jgi:hypothetical protein
MRAGKCDKANSLRNFANVSKKNNRDLSHIDIHRICLYIDQTRQVKIFNYVLNFFIYIFFYINLLRSSNFSYSRIKVSGILNEDLSAFI